MHGLCKRFLFFAPVILLLYCGFLFFLLLRTGDLFQNLFDAPFIRIHAYAHERKRQCVRVVRIVKAKIKFTLFVQLPPSRSLWPKAYNIL